MNNSTTVSIDSGAPAADANTITISERRATFVSDGGKGKSVKYVNSSDGESVPVINLNDFPAIKDALAEVVDARFTGQSIYRLTCLRCKCKTLTHFSIVYIF